MASNCFSSPHKFSSSNKLDLPLRRRVLVCSITTMIMLLCVSRVSSSSPSPSAPIPPQQKYEQGNKERDIINQLQALSQKANEIRTKWNLGLPSPSSSNHRHDDYNVYDYDVKFATPADQQKQRSLLREPSSSGGGSPFAWPYYRWARAGKAKSLSPVQQLLLGSTELSPAAAAAAAQGYPNSAARQLPMASDFRVIPTSTNNDDVEAYAEVGGGENLIEESAVGTASNDGNKRFVVQPRSTLSVRDCLFHRSGCLPVMNDRVARLRSAAYLDRVQALLDGSRMGADAI